MGFSVVTNLGAMDVYKNMSANQSAMQSSLEKLSSGYRINHASDDAAGLTISEHLKSQIGGMQQAARNAQDGISVLQTAEGALNETTAILQRMRDLAVQSANSGAQDPTSQAAAQKEIVSLNAELDHIASSTKFGNTNLLDGTFTSKNFHVGANGTGDDVAVSITGASSTTLGVNSVDVSSGGNADSAITAIDAAIATVSDDRSSLGAVQNRFQHIVNNLNNGVENLTAANSRITDTDMASEMTNFTSKQILVQAGVSVLAQANQSSQAVLKLLG